MPVTGTAAPASTGADLARLPETKVTRERARSIGFVFQTFNLIPRLSAAENVEVALVPLGFPAAKRRMRAQEGLSAVGLGGRLRHLDEGTRDEIIALLEDLCRRGLTMVLATHDSAVAGRAPRLGLMKNGQFEDAP